MSAAPPQGPASPSPEEDRSALLERLRHPGRLAAPGGEDTRTLIERLERRRPADLERDAAQLRGVWELRWSSSSLPYLAVAPWLENLQLLDPELRVCRGNAGTLFALLRRPDLQIEEFLPS